MEEMGENRARGGLGGRQAGRQTGRQTDRQTDRQAYRQVRRADFRHGRASARLMARDAHS